jgi:saccharopine dehydrogenase (NAD+, L-lysine-forming)
MSGRVLLYGATGFTGRLLVERLRSFGDGLILAGRNPRTVEALAGRYGLSWRVFGLEDAAALDATLSDVDVVLHSAGPFVETAAPMMAACLRTRTHYLDMTGEWPVFADAMTRSDAARQAGVMLMPGVGFSVVATDCLLAMAVAANPGAVKLRLAVSSPQVISPGTLVSAAGLMSKTALVRRAGRLRTLPVGELTRDFDFGAGPRSATVFSWPDVVTGEFTTGVADIEAYTEADWLVRAAYRFWSKAAARTDAGLRRAMSRAFALAGPGEPSAAARRRGGFVLVVEAIDRWRRTRTLRMRTMEGYTVSAFAAEGIVRRVLDGQWTAGFQTPGRMFGGRFVLDLGCAALE